jgi:hypothetical protein
VLPQLTNSWAPFVVHSAAQLVPAGTTVLPWRPYGGVWTSSCTVMASCRK